MSGVLITHAALHAALRVLRDHGAERDNDGDAAAYFIDALNVLIALLDAAPPEPQGLARRLAEPRPSLAQEEAQPAHPHTLPDGPGVIAAVVAGTPPAEAPPVAAAPAPAPAQEAGGDPSPEPDADAPPGDTRPQPIWRQRLTPERERIFPDLWRDASLTNKDIVRRLSELPGAEIPNPPALYDMAKHLGLPARGSYAAPQEPAPATPDTFVPDSRADRRTEKASAHVASKGATLPAEDPRKAEVFEAFDGGLTVRDVAADFGIPMSTLSNWHAEWKLRSKKDAAA